MPFCVHTLCLQGIVGMIGVLVLSGVMFGFGVWLLRRVGSDSIQR